MDNLVAYYYYKDVDDLEMIDAFCWKVVPWLNDFIHRIGQKRMSCNWSCEEFLRDVEDDHFFLKFKTVLTNGSEVCFNFHYDKANDRFNNFITVDEKMFFIKKYAIEYIKSMIP